MRNIQLCSLSLVTCPVTSNEFSNRTQKKNIEESFNGSELYAIAQSEYPRLELITDQDGLIGVKIHNSRYKTEGIVNVAYLLELNYPDVFKNVLDRKYTVFCKIVYEPNFYFVVGVKDAVTGDLLQDGLLELSSWQMLFYRSRNCGFLKGFEDYQRFLEFRIHYIGKATASVYQRLSRGHHARTDILSSEAPFNKNNLLSEELVILAFRLDEMKIVEEPDFTETKITRQPNYLVDLVERSIIYSMHPKYNEIKYKTHIEKFKKNDFLDSLVLTINEEIKLKTDAKIWQGKRSNSVFSDSDFILLDESGENLHNIICNSSDLS